MNWDAISAVAELLGVVAVVVSLLYLAFQVRQNTVQLRQDNLLKNVRGTLDTNWYYHRDPVAFEVFRTGVKSFDALPPQEQAHFHSILVDLAFYLQMVWQLAQHGLVDKSAVETNERFLAAILITEGGREWLEYAKKTRPMPPEALEYLGGLVERNPSDGSPITELQRWFGMES
jgi:hypothetical protein